MLPLLLLVALSSCKKPSPSLAQSGNVIGEAKSYDNKVAEDDPLKVIGMAEFAVGDAPAANPSQHPVRLSIHVDRNVEVGGEFRFEFGSKILPVGGSEDVRGQDKEVIEKLLWVDLDQETMEELPKISEVRFSFGGKSVCLLSSAHLEKIRKYWGEVVAGSRPHFIYAVRRSDMATVE